MPNSQRHSYTRLITRWHVSHLPHVFSGPRSGVALHTARPDAVEAPQIKVTHTLTYLLKRRTVFPLFSCQRSVVVGFVWPRSQAQLFTPYTTASDPVGSCPCTHCQTQTVVFFFSWFGPVAAMFPASFCISTQEGSLRLSMEP